MKKEWDGLKPEETANNTMNFKIFTFLVITVFIEIFTLLGLVIYWTVTRGQPLSTVTQQQMCYPRTRLDVILNGTECPMGLDFQDDKLKNVTKCCGTLNDVLNIVVNQTTLYRYNSDINPEIRLLNLTEFNCDKPIQHISVPRLGLAHKKKSVRIESGNKLFWDSGPTSFENTGLRYLEEDGQIIVDKEGLFYILLQLKINVSPTVDVDDDQVRHHVHKVADNKVSTILLEDVTSPCQMASEMVSEKTSVLGAVFSLKQDERLHVTTTHPESIVNDPHNNYFTVFYESVPMVRSRWICTGRGCIGALVAAILCKAHLNVLCMKRVLWKSECDLITRTSYKKYKSEPLRHAMFKYNILDEAKTEVVSNVQPRVISRNWYYNSYSSFVSSLADLKAGDEISVKVSNISYFK